MTEDTKIIWIRMAEFLGILAVLCLGLLLLAVSLKTMSTVGIVIGGIMAMFGFFVQPHDYEYHYPNTMKSKED